jgi:RHH-type proline utilization regulon transcriptional repressor/proline dehydrogenase/delta 1-pyrroline-5-carboxylate dehydrogenase
MTDQVLRIRSPKRAAKRLTGLIQEYGLPEYFSSLDRMALKWGSRAARLLPRLVVPQVKSKVRAESAHVIISAEEQEFEKYLADRKRSGMRVNFNQLGEAVLGAHESDRRMRDNIEKLIEPGVNYLSIKISSIVSQISLTGYAATIETVKRRLREIYRAAIAGGPPQKFVNLDMEEYRDLHLTVDVFRSLLDEPEFDSFSAGIVLQAYLPDSFNVLQSLTTWSRERKQRTGTEIKIRIVKGANLAMEAVEASRRGWPQAPYRSKIESDANFKRMLEFATRPENADAVRIGVGSHNLFDIALAMLLRKERDVAERIEFEMLEGMANAQAEIVLERRGACLVYAPVVLDAEFESAVAYLVRRLDENTAPGSFLGSLFGLTEGSPQWVEQQEAFLESCQLAADSSLAAAPNRTQNRLTETPHLRGDGFKNEPDTDFSLPENRTWAADIIADWEHKTIEPLPLQIGGKFSTENLTGIAADPSRPQHEAYQYAQANLDDIEKALATAVAVSGAAKAIPREQLANERAAMLRQAAVVFAQQRGETIGAMLLDAGKNIMEADTEISEAIDFANYYADSLTKPESATAWTDGTTWEPLGVVVITPPWNFPYAIPAGGVMAALAAGNAVILKPARESVLTAWVAAQQLWEAGVPHELLQFVPTVDGEVGKALVSDPRVGAVVLTGSDLTAKMFLSWRPEMKLLGETSGKNAMIITAAADIDLAVKDLVRGAFGHAGQKCSATSLAIIEDDVYDNPRFMLQLKDATESMLVAGSWDGSALVTPVIRPPDPDLLRGLTQLDPGESWLLEPTMIDENPCLWTPGIRLGVQHNSWYHRTECFGPVLGLIRVPDLAEAIAVQNSSQFGLTGGLHSLDPQEIAIWRESVEVGNAYINRTTTGAIVRRQPFGGWKNSAVGPGSKAGGPNYVAEFCRWQQIDLPKLRSKLSSAMQDRVKQLQIFLSSEQGDRILPAAAESFAYWWENEFSISHDPSQVHGETNEFRYRVRPCHVLRLQEPDSDEGKMLAALTAIACSTVGVEWELSYPQRPQWLTHCLGADAVASVVHREETDPELANRIALRMGSTLRIVGHYDMIHYSAAIQANIPLTHPQVLLNGRVELLNYLREQSMTETMHRYGNIV